MSLPTVLDDEAADLQNGAFLEIDRSSSHSTSGRQSNELDHNLKPDQQAHWPIPRPKERPKTAVEARLTGSTAVDIDTTRQSRRTVGGMVMAESLSPHSGPPYRQRLGQDFLKGILDNLTPRKSISRSKYSGNETASEPLYMVDRFPSFKKKSKRPAPPPQPPPPPPKSPPVPDRSPGWLGVDDNNPATAILQRPYPIPVHDPEESIGLPTPGQSTPFSEKTIPLIPRRPVRMRSPVLSRDEVHERMGEQDVAKIRQLEEKNSQVLANQRLLPVPTSTSKKPPTKPKRKKTKTSWQSIPYGPAAPGGTYDVTATSASNSTVGDPTSPTRILALEHRIRALVRARESAAKNEEPKPSYLRDSGVRTAREAIEAAATKRFFDRNNYEAGQNDDNIRRLPAVNINDYRPVRTHSGSPQAPKFFSPLSPVPPSPADVTEQPRGCELLSEAQPARLEGWALYSASLHLVPAFVRYNEAETAGVQGLETEAMGSVDGLDKEILARSMSFDSYEERSAQMSSGWRPWAQTTSGILIAFNICGIVTSSPLLFLFYAWVLPSMSLSTIIWVGSLQLFFLFSVPPLITPFVERGFSRSSLIYGSFFILVSFIGLSFINVIYINGLDSSVVGGLIALQGLILGTGTSLIAGAGRHALVGYFEQKIGVIMGSCAVAGAIGAVTYQLVIAYGIPKVGFAWVLRILALISLVTLLPAVFLARNPSHLSQTGKPSKTAEIDWSILRDMGFMLTLSGFFFSFWGLSSTFYLLPLSPTLILQIPAPAPLATVLTLSLFTLLSYTLTPLLSSLLLGPLNTLTLSALASTICLFTWTIITSETSLLVLTAFIGISAGSITGLLHTVCLSGSPPCSKTNKDGNSAALSPEVPYLGTRYANIPQLSPTTPRAREPKKAHKAPFRLALLYATIALACLSGPPIAAALARTRGVSQGMSSSFPASTTEGGMVFTGTGGNGGGNGGGSGTGSSLTMGVSATSSVAGPTFTGSVPYGMPTGFVGTPSEEADFGRKREEEGGKGGGGLVEALEVFGVERRGRERGMGVFDGADAGDGQGEGSEQGSYGSSAGRGDTATATATTPATTSPSLPQASTLLASITAAAAAANVKPSGSTSGTASFSAQRLRSEAPAPLQLHPRSSPLLQARETNPNDILLHPQLFAASALALATVLFLAARLAGGWTVGRV